jgi:hypothetical protein
VRCLQGGLLGGWKVAVGTIDTGEGVVKTVSAIASEISAKMDIGVAGGMDGGELVLA